MLTENRQPKMVILVEDSAELCKGWKDLLTFDGYDVHTFESGRQLDQNASLIDKADVFITDYYLPDTNGIELIAKMKKLRANLPVILLTGARDETIVEQLHHYSQSLLLNKPIDIDDLEKGIDQFL